MRAASRAPRVYLDTPRSRSLFERLAAYEDDDGVRTRSSPPSKQAKTSSYGRLQQHGNMGTRRADSGWACAVSRRLRSALISCLAGHAGSSGRCRVREVCGGSPLGGIGQGGVACGPRRPARAAPTRWPSSRRNPDCWARSDSLVLHLALRFGPLHFTGITNNTRTYPSLCSQCCRARKREAALPSPRTSLCAAPCLSGKWRILLRCAGVRAVARRIQARRNGG